MSFSIESVKNNVIFDETLRERLATYQSYIPIYNNFFENNSQDATLNYTHDLEKIHSTEEHNVFLGETSEKQKHKKKIFAKFCPLMDPTKVMVGKETVEGITLPSCTENNSEHPFGDANNSAYVDSFFSFLTSKLLHHHGFVHGLDCYGSLLAIQKDFRVNIQDDVEYLFESEYFLENREKFDISDVIYEQFEPVQSCKYKRRLTIGGEDDDDIQLEFETIEGESSIEIPNSPFDFADCYKDESDLVYIKKVNENSQGSKSKHSTNASSSTCSSRSSITTKDGIDDDYDEYESMDEEEYSSSEEDEDDEPIYATVENFPVNVVFLEGCSETLDDYILNNDIKEAEWSAILMQIIMTLVVLQDKLYFVHNDLHTSNVMFVETDKKHLCYKYADKHYKVPTYGKIWKIIDFGRAVYKFKGKIMFSDSFSEKGDATTQYNCEPYLNPKKKIVPPNFSFDLCRLACSLFDFFEQLEDDGLESIRELIHLWVKDYKGRNILYKKNGDERYPDFKLYKMITRSVHHTVPKEQLNHPLFSQYSVSRKNIRKNQDIMKIDDIPSYVV